MIEVDLGNVDAEFSNIRFRRALEKAIEVYSGTEQLNATDIAETWYFQQTRLHHHT